MICPKCSHMLNMEVKDGRHCPFCDYVFREVTTYDSSDKIDEYQNAADDDINKWQNEQNQETIFTNKSKRPGCGALILAVILLISLWYIHHLQSRTLFEKIVDHFS